MATKAKGGKPQVELQVSAADKKKALETAISQIEKQYGKGAVMKLGQATAMQVDAISTGSLSAWIWRWESAACRAGSIIEIYGPESSGKTTVALQIIAQAQKAGRRGCFYRRGARARSRLCPGAGR